MISNNIQLIFFMVAQ